MHRVARQQGHRRLEVVSGVSVLPQPPGVHPGHQLPPLGPGAEEAPRAQLVVASSPGAEVGVHQGLAMLLCQMLIFTEHLDGVYIIFGSMGEKIFLVCQQIKLVYNISP